MGTRRTFIKKMSALSMTAQMAKSCIKEPISASSDWQAIADQFFKTEVLNFNTGSAGVMPIPVYKKYVDNVKLLSSYAPYEVLKDFNANIKESMDRLSSFVSATPANLSLVRNTTEGLNALLWGLPLEKGDEIIYTNLGYPYVKNTLELLRKKKGIQAKLVSIDNLDFSDEELVEHFEKAITDKTKLLVVTHITHKTGQIMPVRKICDLGKKYGVEVMLDAAHAIGHIPHSLSEIGCDYYVTSMHKWFSAPLGSGLMYIAVQHLEKLFPSYSYPSCKQGEITKFDYTGTTAFQNKMTLSSVLDFNQSIGIDRKAKRLRELSLYLLNGLKNIKGAYSVVDKDRLAGIVTFSLSIRYYKKLVDALAEYHNIHVKMVLLNKLGHLRISLNIHLMESDIDRLLTALQSEVNTDKY